jgi:hypothetical protein
MLLKAQFDQIGKFEDRDGVERDAKKAHFTIGNKGDEVIGGLYLPAGMAFPVEGITVKLKEVMK